MCVSRLRKNVMIMRSRSLRTSSDLQAGTGICATAGSSALRNNMLRIQLVMHCSALPVRRLQGWVEEKREDGRKLHGEMGGKAFDVGDGAGAVEDGAERGDQVASGHGQAVWGHRARVVPIAERQGLMQDGVDGVGQSRPRMILPQEPTASEQMRHTRLVRRPRARPV